MILALVSPSHPDFDWAAKVRRSLALAELSEKAAALHMGVDPSEFSKQLAGMPGHHLSFPRLLRLPHSFWSYLMPDLAAHFGYRLESQDVLATAVAAMLEACGVVMKLAKVLPTDSKNERRRA